MAEYDSKSQSEKKPVLSREICIPVLKKLDGASGWEHAAPSRPLIDLAS
jgi:hypothetical protein